MSKSILASVSIFVSHSGREGNLGNDIFPFQDNVMLKKTSKKRGYCVCCKYFEFPCHCLHREPKAASPICDIAE